MENGMQMTFEEYMPETFQKPTAGVSDSPVLPKELIFLQKKDISQLKMYLSEIRSLRTKEDGEKSQQQCTGTEQDSGTSMDSEYCQQEPRQSMAFADLCAECERMQSDLEEEWIPECFDIFFRITSHTK